MRTNEEIMDILDLRKEELGLSISEIGRQTHIAKSAISMYFNRKRELPLNKIEVFAKVFQLDEDYLLGFKTTDNKQLMTSYNKLSENNQEKVQDYIQTLLEQQ